MFSFYSPRKQKHTTKKKNAQKYWLKKENVNFGVTNLYLVNT